MNFIAFMLSCAVLGGLFYVLHKRHREKLEIQRGLRLLEEYANSHEPMP